MNKRMHISEIFSSKRKLPQGIIRGCRDCDDCQKVIAKWCPEEACRPDLEDAHVFYPTEKEFEDPIRYISSIRIKAEKYGICRIVPPTSWRPPCPLKQEQVWKTTRFETRVQRIHELQNRYSMKKNSENKNRKNKKRRIINTKDDEETDSDTDDEDEGFGFESGPDFTLEEFQAYDHYFKTQYFRKSNTSSIRRVSKGSNRKPTIEDIEGEYWRMVQRPTDKIEVLYGADLETGVFCSGFPKNTDQVDSPCDSKYVNSGWNLNNFPRLPGSVLSYECSDISGVLVPWLYVGMCFSSFCWHVEDHHLYSLNYLHWGEPKIWYGVPSTKASKLEATMKKYLPDLFEEQPDLLHKLVTQISPVILKKEDVPVYRCVQYPGEFVLTFPRAYHAGFNCGFNCAEAVNVAPIDWLPYGQKAIEVYRKEGRSTTISHDKLLLGASREAIKAQWELNFLKRETPDNLRWSDACGENGMLFTALKSRVEMEKNRRESLCKSSQKLKMESNFDETKERECNVCFYDLHLSAAACHNCSPNKYACLDHAQRLCTCSLSEKFFIFRYELNELNLLVDALGGKLIAIHKWAYHMEGVRLSSYKSNENLAFTDNSKPKPEKTKPRFRENVDVVVLSDDDEVEAFGTQVSCIKTSKRRAEKTDLAWGSNGKRGRVMDNAIGNTSSYGNGVETNNGLTQQDNVEENELGSSQGYVVSDKANNEKGSEKSKSNAKSRPLKDDNQNALCNSDGSPKPHMFEVGVVKVGKLWCDTRAIYPKGTSPTGTLILFLHNVIGCRDRRGAGFKSRVRYISVVDPTRMCFYVSEIIDVGGDNPLFMFSMEDFPQEMFANISAVKCWEMVRERINREISKQHNLRTPNLPPLQLPNSVDGFEMFGFTSPEIIQVIEAMDHKRVCIEYWKSRRLLQVSQPYSNANSIVNTSLESTVLILRDTIKGLLKKANRQELLSLHNVLIDNESTVLRILEEEIDQRLR